MASFTVQIGPLLLPDPGYIDEDDLLYAEQFEDVSVHHVLNGWRTAGLTIPMTDPVVAGLSPFAFSVRILYEDRLEPVMFGPANITDNFTMGKCFIDVYDPGIRMAHHYLRRGDAAINDEPEEDKGTINADREGIELVVNAAQNVTAQNTRNDPALGLAVWDSGDRAADTRTAPIVVERGQECAQVVDTIARHAVGPDFDSETSDDLFNYSKIATYANMGTDRTTETPEALEAGEMLLAYVPDGNLTGFERRGGRPSTHAHVLSSDARYRRSAGAIAASNQTGVYVDWIPTDITISEGNDDALAELATARVQAYGVPPWFMEADLHPDAVLDINYGAPWFDVPMGARAPTFYLGDRCTVLASYPKYYREHFGDARIIGVDLTQRDQRSNGQTKVRLVPTVAGEPVEEEVQ